MTDDPRTAFIRAATWHGSLEKAESILATHPELAAGDVHTSAILGDEAEIRRLIELDPACVMARSAPYDGDALTYLCLSKYLRLEPARSDSFLRTAAALLDAGADPNTGFWTTGKHPERETALYGAAGVAHHAGLTRLLLQRGADPNDVEAVYHSPETHDNGAMQALVETGKVTAENLVMMLVRKHDWHDYDGARWLLEHGADPNHARGRGWNPLHHALARDNSLTMFELLLDYGADTSEVRDGLTAVARAAREGRSDVLELFRERGVPIQLTGVDRLIAACAMGHAAEVMTIAEREPRLAEQVRAMGGSLLARFAGTCNPSGVARLLDLGVGVATPFPEGDGYWDEPGGSLPIHIAAWRSCPPVVRLLISRGSPVDTPDPAGRTPLALAVRACVNSYWTDIASPECAGLLLEAGASAEGIVLPTGNPALDEIFRAHGQ